MVYFFKHFIVLLKKYTPKLKSSHRQPADTDGIFIVTFVNRGKLIIRAIKENGYRDSIMACSGLTNT